MPVAHTEISIETRGHHQVLDLTGAARDVVREYGYTDGTLTLFVPGSTAGLTTIEFEEGALQDLEDVFDRIVPMEASYHHNARWGDGNGHSHVRAALMGPSLTVPFAAGQLLLGTWQQIVVIDFDNRPRSRRILMTLIGE
jgi:secondary thiamine-phosphate synthase enzyme